MECVMGLRYRQFEESVLGFGQDADEFQLSERWLLDKMCRVHSKLKGQNSRTSQGPKIAVFKYQKYRKKTYQTRTVTTIT